MRTLTDDGALFSPPRIALAGACRAPLGGADPRPDDALAGVADTLRIDAAASPRGMARLLRDGARAITGRSCEAIHLLDARLALPAVLLRARFGVPVSVTLTPSDLARRRLSPRRRLLGRLDHGFLHDSGGGGAAMPSPLPLTQVPAVAPMVQAPTPRKLDAMSRLLRDLTPGRLVVATPWPADGAQVRWIRDAVMPLLHGNPVCLFLGAPGRRETRIVTGAVGLRGSFRAHVGKLDNDVVAAAARCADVLIVGGAPRRAEDGGAALAALISCGVPLVAAAGVEHPMLAHERNAFAVPSGDAMALVSTVNQLLALPAAQRHALGQEFAAYTQARWTWREAAEIYGERFAALVGRPRIPQALRAA
jgi:hypothetical protein